jgi:hypothetical protein
VLFFLLEAIFLGFNGEEKNLIFSFLIFKSAYISHIILTSSLLCACSCRSQRERRIEKVVRELRWRSSYVHKSGIQSVAKNRAVFPWVLTIFSPHTLTLSWAEFSW